MDGIDLEGLVQIWEAAARAGGGERCAAPPHPYLRRRIKEQLDALTATGDLPGALRLKATDRQRLGLNDGVIIPPEKFPVGASPAMIRSAALERAPLRGVVRVIVVLVDFPDLPMTATRQHFEDLFFSEGVIPTKSVREYYREVTNGLIDIQGDVAGPFRLPLASTAYAHGTSALGSATPNGETLARDALIAADPSVDFTPYDNDGNGYVDAFIVVHAGPGAEVTGKKTDIWSHKSVLDGGARAADGTQVYGYLTVPEDCKIGVCSHELGHLLFGFPDLYDTDYSSAGIGGWCLMSAGSWGGDGDTPTHPCAWCKVKQGWATATNPAAAASVTLDDVKASQEVVRLWKGGAAGPEYFLVENRQQTDFDVSIPGGGLLIWHIDERQLTNSDERHYKVALMQADGQKDLELDPNNGGDGGDCYPGDSGATAFDGTTTPNSNAYSASPTGVAVRNISAPGPKMTFDVEV